MLNASPIEYKMNSEINGTHDVTYFTYISLSFYMSHKHPKFEVRMREIVLILIPNLKVNKLWTNPEQTQSTNS